VVSIRAPRTYQIDPIEVKNPALDFTWVGELVASNTKVTVIDPASAAPQAIVDWGIIDTGADAFWAAYGYQGEGIVVANIDTGVQWNHPALVNQFKCPGDPTDPACWRDPSNVCGAGGACDNNGHGTHTMGTMVADNDPALAYTAGMAPDAQWIACKGCESSSCTDLALNTCADWIVAPVGMPGTWPK
jgi:subtilisin family serine protease